MDELPDPIPMLIILLKEARVVPVDRAAGVVKQELGPDAASTVNLVAGDPQGMRYIDWKFGETIYHLGTCPEPYLKRIGVGKAGEPIRWTMQEEIPPREDRHCEAWMAHTAWMYVDALDHPPPGRPSAHLPNVLRLASHFIDDACVLLWLWGGVDKHVSLPTPRVRAALAKGRWIEE
jgi:hypothetical protein